MTGARGELHVVCDVRRRYGFVSLVLNTHISRSTVLNK